ncbi:MAG: M28 family peptidase, partial [Candidatus Aminicenantes bacterium]|nr:M28 family peptidase [Candidatus Aminicenantes bacterium]
IKKNNRYMGLTIYTRRSRSKSMGSDHSPFARRNIPWIFFFAATTADYHQPSDSFDKASMDLIQKYARLTYLIAFELANQ